MVVPSAKENSFLVSVLTGIPCTLSLEEAYRSLRCPPETLPLLLPALLTFANTLVIPIFNSPPDSNSAAKLKIGEPSFRQAQEPVPALRPLSPASGQKNRPQIKSL